MRAFASPGYLADYRKATEKHAASLAGITRVQKRCMCVACGKMRTEATGKHTKAGFVCHGCGRAAKCN